MILWGVILSAVLAGAAALFALLAFFRSGGRKTGSEVTADQLSQLLRNESDRIRQAGDEQARALKRELADNLRGFQETTLKVFRELPQCAFLPVRFDGLSRLDVTMVRCDHGHQMEA
jgi:hypothetical protein